MAESRQKHRQHIEGGIIAANIAAQRLGTVLGFLVAIMAICGGIYLVAAGMAAGGLASIIAALVALVGVFVYGKQAQQKELAKKSKGLTPL